MANTTAQILRQPLSYFHLFSAVCFQMLQLKIFLEMLSPPGLWQLLTPIEDSGSEKQRNLLQICG